MPPPKAWIRIQENARTSFELMARDIREAGGTPCDVRQQVVNVLSDTTNWWATYGTGISGYDDGAYPGSVAGTDAIQIQYFDDTDILTSAAMAGTHWRTAGECRQQARQHPAAADIGGLRFLRHGYRLHLQRGQGRQHHHPRHGCGHGQCQRGIFRCRHPAPVVYPINTSLGSLRALQWYVAPGSHSGNSLYRRQLRNPGVAGPEMGAAEEVITGVTGLVLTYLVDGAWETSPPGGDWSRVTAVQIELGLEALDSRAGGVENQLITRRLMHVVALRNKL